MYPAPKQALSYACHLIRLALLETFYRETSEMGFIFDNHTLRVVKPYSTHMDALFYIIIKTSYLLEAYY